MKTQCNGQLFSFQTQNRREISATFDGGTITTVGGALLLRETELLTGIITSFAKCFTDHRDSDLIEHTVEHLIVRRIYALTSGYQSVVVSLLSNQRQIKFGEKCGLTRTRRLVLIFSIIQNMYFYKFAKNVLQSKRILSVLKIAFFVLNCEKSQF
jgi:hypothetical protein